jgi:hypothetical protein
MAKRIKIKGKAPRGLSKAQRIKIAPLQREVDRIKVRERSRVDPGDVSESTLDKLDRLDYMIEDIAEQPDIQHGASSARKNLAKEGNRKFIGPRQFGSELAENRGRRGYRDRPEDRDYFRQLRKEYLEKNDPTLVGNDVLGRPQGGLSPSVVKKLKSIIQQIMSKPSMSSKERNFIQSIDATGYLLRK